jgi:hypothetical protein
VPELIVNAEPRRIVHGRIRDLIRSLPNLSETTVSGVRFVHDDSPDEIGTAVAQFVRKPRALAPLGTESAPDHHPGRVGEPDRQRVRRTESTRVKGSKQ